MNVDGIQDQGGRSEIIRAVNLSFIYNSELSGNELNKDISGAEKESSFAEHNVSSITENKMSSVVENIPETTVKNLATSESSVKSPKSESSVKSAKFVKEVNAGASIKKLHRIKRALDSISLTIDKNQFIGLLGPTGSGKSTLVRTFNGLIPHFYSGRFFGYVYVNNLDTISCNIKTLSKYVGLVFQNPENQLVTNSVEKELAFGLENLGIERDVIIKKIDEVLSYLKITHLRRRHPYELSGGEKQRVAIASILILNPEVIILDEPTATLDPQGTLRVLNLLKQVQKEKRITVIIIEHRLEVILPYCDSIMLMKNGQIISHGGINEILELDDFYNLGIEIPGYILLLKRLKERGLINKISTNIGEAKKVLMEALIKKKI